MPTSDGRVVINIDSNARKATSDFNQLDSALSKLDLNSKKIPSSFNQADSAISKMSSSMSVLKGGLIAAGGAFATLKLAEYSKQILDISSQFEQLNVSFEVLAGKEAGGQLVKDLTNLANVTPMTTQGLAENTRMLLSFGEASQNIIGDLKILGDISGGNQEKMNMLSLAFSQMGSAGRLMGQDLLQMVNAGFNPLQVISDKTGKSMGVLRQEMEKGKISFSMVKQAMADATREGGRFYGMMEKQSQTLAGQLSTMSDKWSLVAKAIGDEFLPFAKQATGQMINLADGLISNKENSEKFQQQLNILSINLQIAVKNLEYIIEGLDGLYDAIGTIVPGTELFSKSIATMNINAAKLGLTLSYLLAPLKVLKGEMTFDDVGKEIEKISAQWRGLDNTLIKIQTGKKDALDYSKPIEKTRKAITALNQGFKDSSMPEHEKKTKRVTTEYDKLQQKINILQDKLRMMSIRGQENTNEFAKGKTQLAQYTTQIEKANNSIAVQTNAYDALNYQLQQATLKMNILASAKVVDANKFAQAKNEATQLAIKLEEVRKATQIDIKPYDALNNKISQLKSNLEDMAVSGQAGTPAFDAMKNKYVESLNQMKDANRVVANAAGLDWENVGDSIKQDLASALTTPLQEGETAFERLGNVALNVISMIGQKVIEQLLEEISLTQVLNGVKAVGKVLSFGLFANGGVFQNGNVKAFASGGVVSNPTYFPMSNGGAGLMGEAGAEAIMPLRRTSNGKLGVEATGANSTVNIYNQSQSNIETVKRPNGDWDIFVKKVNTALGSERTQNGFTKAASRQNPKGIQAA